MAIIKGKAGPIRSYRVEFFVKARLSRYGRIDREQTISTQLEALRNFLPLLDTYALLIRLNRRPLSSIFFVNTQTIVSSVDAKNVLSLILLDKDGVVIV